MDNDASEYAKYYKVGIELVRAAPQLYMDIDVEADGKPGFGSMLSLGAVSAYGDEFYRELKPLYSRWLPEQRKFCESHGLERERLLDEGHDPALAIIEFDEWSREQQIAYNKKGLVFTAFNASFDFPLVDLYYAEIGLENPYQIAGYCIKSLAQALRLNNYDWHATKKTALPAEILPKDNFTHNALEDAKWQQGLHFAMVGRLGLQATKLRSYEYAQSQDDGWYDK